MQYGSSLVTPSVVLLLYIIGDFLYCALHVNLVSFVTRECSYNCLLVFLFVTYGHRYRLTTKRFAWPHVVMGSWIEIGLKLNYLLVVVVVEDEFLLVCYVYVL